MTGYDHSIASPRVTQDAAALAEQLETIGWSPEGAAFLAVRAGAPALRGAYRRLTGKIPPRQRTSTPKKSIGRSFSKRVFERDAYRCVECGSWHDLTVDHIIPESKGGPLTLENTRTLCRSCNSRKGVR